MSTEIPKDKCNNLTPEERGALFDFKNDKNIVIKGTNKGAAVVVWDRNDYIQESDKKVYEEVSNDPQPLINTIHRIVEK